jgi:hypothetical protein
MPVVLGARTRLARSLLGLAWGEAAVAVARDDAEARWVETEFPGVRVVPAACRDGALPRAAGAVGILACAVGLIHPAAPDRPVHERTAARDLAALAGLLEAYRDAPVHALFVSSVLALGFHRERAYYAGWKLLLEGTLAGLVRQHPRARFSVVYPGRLVLRRTVDTPLSYLHTTYDRLAAIIRGRVHADRARRQVVGIDARLWLLARGARTVTLGAVGRA